MNTHLGKVEERLKEAGCVFYKNKFMDVTWTCVLDGKIVAKGDTKPLCIKDAAKALGEPL